MCEHCAVLIQALGEANKRISELEAEKDIALALVPPKNKQYLTVQAMRARGMTYAEIGRQIGLTRQRVHQICQEETTHE